VEDVLYAKLLMPDIHHAERNTYLGPKSINQWIWENKVKREIPANLLREFLSRGMHNAPHVFMKKLEHVRNLLILTTELHGITSDHIQNEHLLNPKSIQQGIQHLAKDELTSSLFHFLMEKSIQAGLLSSELLGLEWKHIDFSTGVIDVRQTMIHALKGEVIVKQPKTKKSVRKVALPSSVLEELKEYHAFRIKERNDVGDTWRGGEWFFLFSHPDGQPFHHERPYQWFRHFIQKHGFRYIRFHDLRHTSATILINQGVHAKFISERLGYGSITTTMNIYGHALRTADQAAADKFDSLFTMKTVQGQ
jgi:integrase